MNISVLDASNYFKGLLLLVRKDRKVSEPEIEIMRHVGKRLGFEKEFCDNAINEILDNTYILDTPPRFATPELAVKFVRDGFALAFADNVLDPAEEHWLKATIAANQLGEEILTHEREKAAARHILPERLEVDDLTVETLTSPAPAAPVREQPS
jgi:hypothetical protein